MRGGRPGSLELYQGTEVVQYRRRVEVRFRRRGGRDVRSCVETSAFVCGNVCFTPNNPVCAIEPYNPLEQATVYYTKGV